MRDLVATVAVLLGLVALLAGPFALAAPGPAEDMHYFETQVIGTGTAEADYGEDRLTAKNNTSGVDGKATLQWRWEVRAAAFSKGNGPLLTRAVTNRQRLVATGSVLSWGKGLVEIGVTPLCGEDQGTKTTLSSDGRRLSPSKGGKGDFVDGGFFALRHGGIESETTSELPSLCFHGSLDEHRTSLDEEVNSREAPVPRGAFTPRSDRRYSDLIGPVELRHDRVYGSDPNAAHLYTSTAAIEIQIKSISRRRFDKLVRKYQHLPAGSGDDVVTYRDPPS